LSQVKSKPFKAKKAPTHESAPAKGKVANTLPKSYARSLHTEKCLIVFEHIYESCPEQSAGIYATAS